MGFGETQPAQNISAADVEAVDFVENSCSSLTMGAILAVFFVLNAAPIESLQVIQYLSIRSIALSATVWPQFQCRLTTPKLDASFWGFRVDVGGRKWHQSKYWWPAHLKPIMHRLGRIHCCPKQTDRHRSRNNSRNAIHCLKRFKNW